MKRDVSTEREKLDANMVTSGQKHDKFKILVSTNDNELNRNNKDGTTFREVLTAPFWEITTPKK